MKINFNVPFKDYKGIETKQIIAEKVAEALFCAGNGGDSISSEDKYKAYKICRKIAGAEGEVEISVDEAKMIKDICSRHLVAGGYGQLHELIEGGK